MMKHAANSSAWAIGTKRRNGFHVRRIVWGLLMAQCEARPGEEVRAAHISVETYFKQRSAVAPELTGALVTFVHPNVRLNRARHTISRGDAEVRLSPTQFLILNVLAKAKTQGIPLGQLFELVYAGTDAPITGRKAVTVQRNVINHKLKPLALTIKSQGPGFRDAAYELVVQ